ncbi:hypothetical protein CMV24_22770 [Pseudomonas plecoglossicida]|uniref:Uncharacterized protein n=2 Tax=Pseudomonas TaxID=286 RepID=A0A2A3LZS2_PSEDL|nr:hypothetical protein O164_28690 [Pseudomonas taiwanensis SJ9]PBJ93313.1 hypothetical protein CMV24_22770 [Pseudomonas plecoglossicida]
MGVVRLVHIPLEQIGFTNVAIFSRLVLSSSPMTTSSLSKRVHRIEYKCSPRENNCMSCMHKQHLDMMAPSHRNVG